MLIRLATRTVHGSGTLFSGPGVYTEPQKHKLGVLYAHPPACPAVCVDHGMFRMDVCRAVSFLRTVVRYSLRRQDSGISEDVREEIKNIVLGSQSDWIIARWLSGGAAVVALFLVGAGLLARRLNTDA
jgi:hypothetical protein